MRVCVSVNVCVKCLKRLKYSWRGQVGEGGEDVILASPMHSVVL